MPEADLCKAKIQTRSSNTKIKNDIPRVYDPDSFLDRVDFHDRENGAEDLPSTIIPSEEEDQRQRQTQN